MDQAFNSLSLDVGSQSSKSRTQPPYDPSVPTSSTQLHPTQDATHTDAKHTILDPFMNLTFPSDSATNTNSSPDFVSPFPVENDFNAHDPFADLSEFFSPQVVNGPAQLDDSMLEFFSQKPEPTTVEDKTPTEEEGATLFSSDDPFAVFNIHTQNSSTATTTSTSQTGTGGVSSQRSKPAPPSRPVSRPATSRNGNGSGSGSNSSSSFNSPVSESSSPVTSTTSTSTSTTGTTITPAIITKEDMSRRSALLGTGVAPPIPPRNESESWSAIEARELQGNTKASNTLASRSAEKEELLYKMREDFLVFNPHQTMVLKVQCITWNMYGKPPPPKYELDKFIPVGVNDIYIIGTEECENSIQKSLLFSSKAKWVAALKEIMGDAYVQIAAETMQAIHLIIFARREICPFINNVETQKVPTGIGDMLGNKGAVAIALDIGTTSFLVINSHFTSGEGKVINRNGDYHKINARLTLRSYDYYNKQRTSLHATGSNDPYASFMAKRSSSNASSTPALPALSTEEQDTFDQGTVGLSHTKSPSYTSANIPAEHRAFYADTLFHPEQDAVNRFDIVIWMGDLNYRVQAVRKVADYMIRNNMLNELFGVDELSQQMRSNQVFHGFLEGPITFPPTYKYDVYTDRYDSSEKNRVPSWTDRILWKSNGNRVLLEKYDHAETVRTSDHRPVYANFLMKIGRGQPEPVVTSGNCNPNMCPTQ